MKTNAQFLQELQTQAKRQATLHQNSPVPARLNFITAFIGNYPWQTLLILSGLSAVLLLLISGSELPL